MSQTLNIFAVGASRNIGYFACLRLLDAGASITFLLRNPDIFDNDQAIQKAVSAGKARLVQGDALSESDCAKGWQSASSSGPVDYLLFTLGGKPTGFRLTKGFVISPPNLVTQAFLNVVCSMPHPSSPESQAPQPKIIVISSIGLTKASHQALPLPLKPMYSWLLGPAHVDKLGMERAAAHIAGWDWSTNEGGEPSEEIMGSKDWESRQGMPPAASFKNDVLVVRPALYTDGPCRADQQKASADKPPYRVTLDELSTYTISRRDVAHFISNVILEENQQSWTKWQGKIVNIGY